FHQALYEGRPAPVSADEGRRTIAWIARGSAAADREREEHLSVERSRPLEPARILVTGGSGLLGSELVKRLRQRGEPIRLLLRRPATPGIPAHPASPGGPVSFVYGSLGQPEVVDRAVTGIEVVYH